MAWIQYRADRQISMKYFSSDPLPLPFLMPQFCPSKFHAFLHSTLPFLLLLLTRYLQTSSNPFDHPPYSCDCRTSSSFCALLQAFPFVCSDSYLCDSSRYSTWTHTSPRSVYFHTFGIYCHPPLSSFRSLLFLLAIYFSQSRPADPSSTPYRCRDCLVLLSYPSSQVLSTTSTSTLAIFSSSQRAHHHCLQCWAYARGDNMAYSTWS